MADLVTRADLAVHARDELGTRELHYPGQVKAEKRTADEAGRGLAAWRAIVALLEHGTSEFEQCLGTTPAKAWPHLVEAAEAAVEHRLHQALIRPEAAFEARMVAMRELRTLLIRSAVRQGAVLTSIPEPGRKAA